MYESFSSRATDIIIYLFSYGLFIVNSWSVESERFNTDLEFLFVYVSGQSKYLFERSCPNL